MRTILLRPILLALAAMVLTSTAPLTAQTKGKTPKKGDTLIVKGCLRGSAVESAQVMTLDSEGEARVQDEVPSLTYRLQGEKDLLKSLKTKHDRHVVEVKGILRSDLSGSGLGTSVGRTRIAIGVDPRTARSPHDSSGAVPVLEAIAFEGTTVSCDR